MKALMPLLPVFNHRLGVAYVAAVLRRDGHEVVPIDFEQILRMTDPQLSLDLQDQTEVYADRWSRQIQYFHRPELLLAALFEHDPLARAGIDRDDEALIERLRPHVEQWCDVVVACEPDLLLLPSLVSNLWIVLWLAAEIRARAPHVFRVLGGRGVTYSEVQELVLRAGWADAVLTGEAEASIGPLVTALSVAADGWSGIPGLAYLRGDRIVSAPAGPRVDLDALPLPDLTGLPFPGASLQLYSESGREFHDATSLATSRWCPYRCAYCYESITPKNYRLRRLDAVMTEIERQRERHGTPRLFFCDSTLNVSPEWLRGLATRMTQLTWQPQVVFAHCEPTRLTRDLLGAMWTAGFEKLNFGVESLDARTLARMERRPRIPEMRAVFTAAVQENISLGLNIIANFPGETEDEFRTTLDGVRELAEELQGAATGAAGVRLMVSQARIDPHSSLFVNRERFAVRVTRRPLPVPRALGSLAPLIEPLALEWTDGTSEQQRRSRFSILRTYAESLSWVAPARERLPIADARLSIDSNRVPDAIAALLRRVPPVSTSIAPERCGAGTSAAPGGRA